MLYSKVKFRCICKLYRASKKMLIFGIITSVKKQIGNEQLLQQETEVLGSQ